MATATANEDYMALQPSVGIVPKAQRNRGYDKLAFGPGEGGLGDSRPRSTESAGDFAAFLAAVAAGADPKEYAQQMLSNQTGRARRGQKGAVA